MRKMKRGLSLVLASIMATALVGCSGGENTETTNTATTTENKETTGTTQAADENQEEITLRFVSWQTNHDEQNQKVAAAYKELHPNINVQFDYVGDMNSNDYLTKTDIMLMGGEAMDILMAPNYASYIVRAESGSYLSLDDYFTEEGTTAEDASGSEMASAISALGATATNNNVPLEEQLAILGQLQTTMSGSEAATKYKSFLNQATKAGEALGLQLTDDNNRLLSTPEILEKLKGKYGETIDAVEKKELKDAFGTDEAVAMIDLLYNNVDSLTTGVDDLSASMKQGSSVTKEMAEAINNTPEQKFQVLKQQIHNNAEELGNGLLPAVNDTMDKVSGLIKRGGEWISNNQQTVQTIMNIALKLGVFLAQLRDMQNLFKGNGQDKPKLLPIVNDDCAARGITQRRDGGAWYIKGRCY